MTKWIKRILGSLLAVTVAGAALLYIAFLLFWPNPLPGRPYEKQIDLSKGEAILIPFKTGGNYGFFIDMTIPYDSPEEQKAITDFYSNLQSGNSNSHIKLKYLHEKPDFEFRIFDEYGNQIFYEISNIHIQSSNYKNNIAIRKAKVILEKGIYILFARPLLAYRDYEGKLVKIELANRGK
jgi:hypothetical protein